MKHLFTLFCVATINVVIAQSFTGTVSPANLDIASSQNIVTAGSCASLNTSQTNVITFSVSGVGTLNNTTNQLANIDLVLDPTCGTQTGFTPFAIYIIEPGGTCALIKQYSASGANYSNQTTNVKLTFRNRVSTSACPIDVYNFSSTAGDNTKDNLTNSMSTTSNSGYGIGGTVDDIATTFDGKNADGTWKIFFSRNGSAATNVPCVVSSSILFGDPRPADFTAQGDNCSNAVNYTGGPICVSNAGLTRSPNMPGFDNAGTSNCNGSISYTNSFASGQTCNWNLENNNDLWITFTPTTASLGGTTGNVCITLSGITTSQQSIIVEDGNYDGDNSPCTFATSSGTTGFCGTYWNILSCPTDIANYTSSSTGNRTQCFTATAGKQYFLVIDGNSGVSSSFYITGITGLPDVLPVELLSFKGRSLKNKNILNWATANERNNKMFEVQRSKNGTDFEKIGEVSGSDYSNSTINYTFEDTKPAAKNYYRIVQIDYNSAKSYSNIVHLVNNAENIFISSLSNINNETLQMNLSFSNTETMQIEIFNTNGNTVYSKTITNDFYNQQIQHLVDIKNLNTGIYYVRASANGYIHTQKFVR